MSLEEVLKRVIERRTSSSYFNEEQTKQSIITPILRELGWDVDDSDEVKMEYKVKPGNRKKIDYALFKAGRIPKVFIEAKRPGKANNKAVQQLFRYAADDRVPLLILTDGKSWEFYLGHVGNDQADQLFHQMELSLKEEIPEYIESLERYLRRGRIVPRNSAVNAALNVYQEEQERKKTRDAIPGVWRNMLETPNRKLCDLLMKEIKSEFQPKLKLADLREAVDSFLKGQGLLSNAISAPSRSKSKKSASTSLQPTSKPRSALIGFSLDGEDFNKKSAKETLAEILKEFQNRDPDFMERLAKEKVGTKNRLVARNRNDLYADPKFVEKASLDLGNGWWLGTSLSTERIRKHIQTACEVAGVKFGTELTLIEPDASHPE